MQYKVRKGRTVWLNLRAKSVSVGSSALVYLSAGGVWLNVRANSVLAGLAAFSLGSPGSPDDPDSHGIAPAPNTNSEIVSRMERSIQPPQTSSLANHFPERCEHCIQGAQIWQRCPSPSATRSRINYCEVC